MISSFLTAVSFLQCWIKLVDTKILHHELRLIVKRSGKNICFLYILRYWLREIHTVSFDIRLHMCMCLEQSKNIPAKFGGPLVET